MKIQNGAKTVQKWCKINRPLFSPVTCKKHAASQGKATRAFASKEMEGAFSRRAAPVCSSRRVMRLRPCLKKCMRTRGGTKTAVHALLFESPIRDSSNMALTNSTMLPLGTTAPDFSLPDINSKIMSLADFKGAPALLVMFMCNHCPYVQHVAYALAKLAREYQQKGVAVVGINSNDAQKYPADSPAMMRQEVKRVGYTFPYLYDESQEVAKAYRAACTPEFYVFDKQRKLASRGRFDASSPGNSVPPTGNELRGALDAVLAGKTPAADQKPSMGCNIKWKPGNEPDYFG